MRRRIVWIIVGVPRALISVATGTAAALPAARHIVSALWNLTDRLRSLAENRQVHFEPGAEDYAHDVSALLPAAIARIEAAHGPVRLIRKISNVLEWNSPPGNWLLTLALTRVR